MVTCVETVVKKGRDFLLKKTIVYLSENTYEILKKGAKDNFCTLSYIIRVAVKSFISKKGWYVKYDSSKESK